MCRARVCVEASFYFVCVFSESLWERAYGAQRFLFCFVLESVDFLVARFGDRSKRRSWRDPPLVCFLTVFFFFHGVSYPGGMR